MKQVIRKLAETPERLQYQTLRNAKRGSYDTWLLQQEHAQKMREELEALDGEDHMSEGYFGEQPIRAIQIYFLRHEETRILYGDEDVLTEKGPSSPWFGELLLSRQRHRSPQGVAGGSDPGLDGENGRFRVLSGG